VQAVTVLQERFEVSDRKACTVVGQTRFTQRFTPPASFDDELVLRAWLMTVTEAAKAGWSTNRERIHRRQSALPQAEESGTSEISGVRGSGVAAS